MTVLAFCLVAFAGICGLVHFAANVFHPDATDLDRIGLAFSVCLILAAQLLLPGA